MEHLLNTKQYFCYIKHYFLINSLSVNMTYSNFTKMCPLQPSELSLASSAMSLSVLSLQLLSSCDTYRQAGQQEAAAPLLQTHTKEGHGTYQEEYITSQGIE